MDTAAAATTNAGVSRLLDFDAVVIETRDVLVEVHAKRANWEAARLTKADGSIDMPEFGLSCRIADLYRGTPLDPQRGGFG